MKTINTELRFLVADTRQLGDTDELIALVPPVGGLTALGGLVGEHCEGAGQGSADGSGHGHPVGSSDLTAAEDEGVGFSTDIPDLVGPPAGRVGQQAQREEDSSEHLDRPAELNRNTEG